MKVKTLSPSERKEYEDHQRRVEREVRRIFDKYELPAPPPAPRGYVSETAIRNKTAGSCHMCGDSLRSRKTRNGIRRRWHIGHVKPYRLGGECTEKNCLPICAECNRLRWNFAPEVLRLILVFGRYAKQPIRHDRDLGDKLIEHHVRETWSNRRRRHKSGSVIRSV